MSELNVFFDSDSTNAKQMIEEKTSYNIVDCPDKADLIWLRKGYSKLFNKLSSRQLLNHIPKQFSMTNKGYLTGYLNQYEQLNSHLSHSPRHFYPESIRLYIMKERERFLLNTDVSEEEVDPWLLKRTDLSQGIGLHMLPNLKDLRDYYINGRLSDLIEKIGEEHYVLQRYVKDVLLLNQRKSEIRIYWLIASLDPLTVLVYKEGTVRVCFEPFKLDDYDNKLIHVTNIYQQSRQSKFNENFQSKWSFKDFKDYLIEEDYTQNPEYVDKVIMDQIGQSLLCVVNAIKNNLLKAPNQGHFFGLYGADFILDNKLRPWLTEVQISPGLSFNDPIKKNLLPEMFAEAFSIVFEIRNKKVRKEAINSISSIKNFRLVTPF